jgi:hypothetical protein
MALSGILNSEKEAVSSGMKYLREILYFLSILIIFCGLYGPVMSAMILYCSTGSESRRRSCLAGSGKNTKNMHVRPRSSSLTSTRPDPRLERGPLWKLPWRKNMFPSRMQVGQIATLKMTFIFHSIFFRMKEELGAGAGTRS